MKVSSRFDTIIMHTHRSTQQRQEMHDMMVVLMIYLLGWNDMAWCIRAGECGDLLLEFHLVDPNELVHLLPILKEKEC
jgi:hypothetical protein